MKKETKLNIYFTQSYIYFIDHHQYLLIPIPLSLPINYACSYKFYFKQFKQFSKAAIIYKPTTYILQILYNKISQILD